MRPPCTELCLGRSELGYIWDPKSESISSRHNSNLGGCVASESLRHKFTSDFSFDLGVLSLMPQATFLFLYMFHMNTHTPQFLHILGRCLASESLRHKFTSDFSFDLGVLSLMPQATFLFLYMFHMNTHTPQFLHILGRCLASESLRHKFTSDFSFDLGSLSLKPQNM